MRAMRAKGGQPRGLAHLQLRSRKADVIVPGGAPDGHGPGAHGLDDHEAGFAAAPRAPRDLADQLEGAFGGAEVWKVEGGVGADDPDEAHPREVEALGDHLGAEHDPGLAPGKAVKGREIVAGRGHGVGVNAQEVFAHDQAELVGQLFFDALRAQAQRDRLLAAERAECRHELLGEAVMAAHELASGHVLAPVQHHRGVASLAGHAPAAGSGWRSRRSWRSRAD
jgi:hypothetical protein